MSEMRFHDKEMFFHYTRCTVEQFDKLISLVSPFISKKSNRTPLNTEHRLAIYNIITCGHVHSKLKDVCI